MARSTTAPAAAGDQTDQTPPETGFWRYQGGVPRLYMDVPITVEHGDVIAHDGPPAGDGYWVPDPGPATRCPDNAPAEQAPTGTGEE